MKRKYMTDLKIGNRIDLLINKDFRIVTNISVLNDNDCMVKIKNYEVVKAHLEKLSHKEQLKGLYYTDDQVFGFEINYKSLVNDEKVMIIHRPMEFFKVRRRQQVRVDWFAKLEYSEVEKLDNYHLIQDGAFLKDGEPISFTGDGFILNLSGSGMEIKTLQPIQTTFVICRFKFKGENYTYLSIRRRTFEVDEFGVKTYRTGLEFINLSNELLERTIKIVFEKMREIQRKRIG